jgi:hypothetical protein
MSEPSITTRFPLLAQLSELRGMPMLPVYQMGDAARLFGAKRRTMNDRAADGQLTVRDLPGRGRFLPQDLEEFIAGSAKNRKPPNPELESEGPRRRRRKP